MIFWGRISLGKAKCGIPAWKYNSESELITYLSLQPQVCVQSLFLGQFQANRFLLGTFGNWFLPPGPTTGTAHIFINTEILLHTSAEIPAKKLSPFADHVLPACHHLALAGICAAFFSMGKDPYPGNTDNAKHPSLRSQQSLLGVPSPQLLCFKGVVKWASLSPSLRAPPGFLSSAEFKLSNPLHSFWSLSRTALKSIEADKNCAVYRRKNVIQADNCQTLKEWICKKNATLLVLWATFPDNRHSFSSEDPFYRQTNLWCK